MTPFELPGTSGNGLSHANSPESITATQSLALIVHAMRIEADGVMSLDLRASDGALLPAFEAGSHIDVHIPVGADGSTGNGVLVRQYSLCNAPSERHRYVIGVGRDPASRGGSVYLHDRLRQADRLHVGTPRNHFALDESAAQTILIAGGIGITPMMAMAHRLSALGKPWTLYYCVRTPERAAFLADLQALGGRVIPVYSDLPGIAMLDLEAVARHASRDTHLYCCGPTPLLQAFEKAMASRDPGTVHVEWFKARDVDTSAAPGVGHAFDVHLAKSGKTFHIPVDQTILDVLIDAKVDVNYGCCEGVCGSCETRVLDGRPEHRDSILAGRNDDMDRMMICVSRCAGKSLTLDL